MKSRKMLTRNVLEKHAGTAFGAHRQARRALHELLQPNRLSDFTALNRFVLLLIRMGAARRRAPCTDRGPRRPPLPARYCDFEKFVRANLKCLVVRSWGFNARFSSLSSAYADQPAYHLCSTLVSDDSDTRRLFRKRKGLFSLRRPRACSAVARQRSGRRLCNNQRHSIRQEPGAWPADTIITSAPSPSGAKIGSRGTKALPQKHTRDTHELGFTPF